jgi:glucose-1-phosphate thymidylyltransferase
LAGIREIQIVSTQQAISQFKDVFLDGAWLGCEITYQVQPEPRGIADAVYSCKEFIGNSEIAVSLGDNIFHGVSLGTNLKNFRNIKGAQIFGYEVSNPSDYGVVEISHDGQVVSIVEKPSFPKSNFAIPGLYFYDSNAIDLIATLDPSPRGELEISDLNSRYLELGHLSISILPRGTVWLDTGTVSGLHDAATYVRVIEERQGLKIGCIEEIVWRNGWISTVELERLADLNSKNEYSTYLRQLLNENQ